MAQTLKQTLIWLQTVYPHKEKKEAPEHPRVQILPINEKVLGHPLLSSVCDK